jgi:hypothetical protein
MFFLLFPTVPQAEGLKDIRQVVDGARQRGDGIAAGDGLKGWP